LPCPVERAQQAAPLRIDVTYSIGKYYLLVLYKGVEHMLAQGFEKHPNIAVVMVPYLLEK
jgi:hypothetical protein